MPAALPGVEELSWEAQALERTQRGAPQQAPIPPSPPRLTGL